MYLYGCMSVWYIFLPYLHRHLMCSPMQVCRHVRFERVSSNVGVHVRGCVGVHLCMYASVEFRLCGNMYDCMSRMHLSLSCRWMVPQTWITTLRVACVEIHQHSAATHHENETASEDRVNVVGGVRAPRPERGLQSHVDGQNQ